MPSFGSGWWPKIDRQAPQWRIWRLPSALTQQPSKNLDRWSVRKLFRPSWPILAIGRTPHTEKLDRKVGTATILSTPCTGRALGGQPPEPAGDASWIIFPRISFPRILGHHQDTMFLQAASYGNQQLSSTDVLSELPTPQQHAYTQLHPCWYN